MAASFPTSIVNLTNPNPATDDLDSSVGGLTHSGHHGKLNDEVEAIETKLGTGSSTPSSGTVLRGTGAGTSAFGQIMNADVATSAAIALSKVNITGEAAPSGGLATGDKLATYDVSAAVNAATTAGSILNLTSGDITMTTGGVASIGSGKVTSDHILNATIVAGDISTTAGIYAGQTDASVARQNLIPNGGFEIWQNGTSGFTTHNTPSADNWVTIVSASTYSISRQTSTDSDVAGQYVARMAYTHAGGGSALTAQYLPNYAAFASRVVTFSLRVKADAASRAYISIYDGVGITGSTYNTGTGWETLTVTRTINGSPTMLRLGITFDQATTTVDMHAAVLTLGSYAAGYIPLQPGSDNAGIMLANIGQVAFPATQNASSGVNVLDDYEEYTWTPTLVGSTTAGVHTYGGSNAGRYTKIGRLVHIEFTLDVSTVGGTIAGNFQIGGLPFSGGVNYGAIACGLHRVVNLTAGYTALTLRMTSGVYIEAYENGDNVNGQILGVAAVGNGLLVFGGGTYAV